MSDKNIRYVKILKSSSELYWYKDDIGKIFKVIKWLNENYYLQSDTKKYIERNDCIEVSEHEYIVQQTSTSTSNYNVSSDGRVGIGTLAPFEFISYNPSIDCDNITISTNGQHTFKFTNDSDFNRKKFIELEFN